MTAQTAASCAERSHPLATYNPWLDKTWCRCGQRVEPSRHPVDWDALWAERHGHTPSETCYCYTSK